MDDLISKKALLESINNEAGQLYIIEHGLEDFILKFPISYNVDKVIKELEGEYCCKNCEFADDIEHCPSGECAEKEVMDDIINIVRKGGIEFQ